jgi:hypothetical protein
VADVVRLGMPASGLIADETFEGGHGMTWILDAAYRSLRSGRWEPVVVDDEVATG